MAKLVLKFKDTTIKEFPITKSPVMVGREHNNDIVIENLSVSRYHIKILQNEDHYFVDDLSSGNGTFIKDKQVTTDALRDKDEIMVGKHTLVFLNDENVSIVEREEIETTALAEETFILNAKTLPAIMALRSGKKPDVDEKLNNPEKPNEQTKFSDQESAPKLKKLTELVNLSKQEKSAVDEARPAGKKVTELDGEIEIIAGDIYPGLVKLTKRTTIGGKGKLADIKVKGFFVGGVAFIISKKPEGFFITQSEGRRITRVNGVRISEPLQLQDGDIIAIGATKMRFYCKNRSDGAS